MDEMTSLTLLLNDLNTELLRIVFHQKIIAVLLLLICAALMVNLYYARANYNMAKRKRDVHKGLWDAANDLNARLIRLEQIHADRTH